jgi:hypothetical protein
MAATLLSKTLIVYNLYRVKVPGGDTMRKIWIVQSTKLDEALVYLDRTLAHHKFVALTANYPEHKHQLLLEEEVHIPESER